ncbi:MAG: UbiA family prenyltransferase [Chloroflexota bacterium]
MAVAEGGAVTYGQARAWLTLARISNSPTVISNVAVGVALAGGAAASVGSGLVALAMVLFYTAGMILNDVCDLAWDRVHRPTRPIPAGVVSRAGATAAVVGLFGLGLALLGLVSAWSVLAGLVLIGVIVLYDAWHKSNPLSPLVMALCRVGVYVTAFASAAWPPNGSLGIAAGLLVLYMVGLTAIAKSEAQPSATGYWPAAILFGAPLWFVFQGGAASPVVMVLGVAFIAWVAYSIRFVYRTEGRSIGGAIARLIAGISLYDAVVLASLGSTGGVAVALVAFALTLWFQRFIEGT